MPDAVRRELFEELGISADETEIRLAVRGPFSCVFDDFYICSFYKIKPYFSGILKPRIKEALL